MKYFILITLISMSDLTQGQLYRQYTDLDNGVHISFPVDNLTSVVPDSRITKYPGGCYAKKGAHDLFYSSRNTEGKETECKENFTFEFSCGMGGSLMVIDKSIAHNLYLHTDSGELKYRYFVLQDSCRDEHFNTKKKYRQLIIQFFFYNRTKEFSLICKASKDRFPDCEKIFFEVANSVWFDE